MTCVQPTSDELAGWAIECVAESLIPNLTQAGREGSVATVEVRWRAVIPGGPIGFRISYAGGDGNDVTLTAATRLYYLSEGATGPFFDRDILLANPHETAAPVALTFLPEGAAAPQTMTIELAPLSRRTIRVDEITAVVEYLLDGGGSVVKHHVIPAQSRTTIAADAEGADRCGPPVRTPRRRACHRRHGRGRVIRL